MSATEVLSDANGSLDGYEKSRGGKGASSKKDVSHVPCKFFRVGSCTAGSSCPFSHSAIEPGQQKETCAWFVKGNCKFGHKCALAHVLPGQSMAMDRRNKKAAQIAANAAASGVGQSGQQQPQMRDRERERERERDAVAVAKGRRAGPGGVQNGGGTASTRNGSFLQFGSTAPTRMPTSGVRPPIPLVSKAAPAPAAPAPALKDTDFTFDSFAAAAKGIPSSKVHGQDGSAQLSRAQNDEGFQEESTEGADSLDVQSSGQTTSGPPPSSTGGISSPLASSPFLATPTKPHRFTNRHASSNSVDFGPVGSPPRSSPGVNPVRINGFSPATSPRNADIGDGGNVPPGMTQPTFSAPGPQSLFSQQNADLTRGRTGPTQSSLTAGSAAMPFTVGSLPVLSSMTTDAPSFSSFAEALDDEDMEEFVPSSLKDLLTPEEQSRRMSRTSSTNPGLNGVATSIVRPGVQQQLSQENRHRHSHSVPGTSMLGQDIRSIWADQGNDQADPASGFRMGVSPTAGAFGTPSSFVSAGGALGKDGPSPSMLHPSNASAAFLGLHHYMGRDGPQRMGQIRASSQGNVHAQDMQRAPSSSSNLANGKELSGGTGGIPPSISSSLLTTGRPSYDSYQASTQSQSRGPMGAPPSAFGRGTEHLGLGAPPSHISPSSRALQAHAPGQSLPQGLAAGYSRIHLQPAAAFSPGSHGGLSDIGSAASPGSVHDWSSGGGGTPGRQQSYYHHLTHQQQQQRPEQVQAQIPTSSPAGLAAEHPSAGVGSVAGGQEDLGGLTSMFSHLSYSSVTAGSGVRLPPSGNTGPPPPGLTAPSSAGQNSNAAASGPLSMSRRSSARGWGGHNPLSSPLSGPVLTNDDDDLFSMDEEK